MMHIIFREGWQDEDYLDRYCLGGEQLRERVPEGISARTGGGHHRH